MIEVPRPISVSVPVDNTALDHGLEQDANIVNFATPSTATTTTTPTTGQREHSTTDNLIQRTVDGITMLFFVMSSSVYHAACLF